MGIKVTAYQWAVPCIIIIIAKLEYSHLKPFHNSSLFIFISVEMHPFNRRRTMYIHTNILCNNDDNIQFNVIRFNQYGGSSYVTTYVFTIIYVNAFVLPSIIHYICFEHNIIHIELLHDKSVYIVT